MFFCRVLLKAFHFDMVKLFKTLQARFFFRNRVIPLKKVHSKKGSNFGFFQKFLKKVRTFFRGGTVPWILEGGGSTFHIRVLYSSFTRDLIFTRSVGTAPKYPEMVWDRVGMSFWDVWGLFGMFSCLGVGGGNLTDFPLNSLYHPIHTGRS